MLHLQREQGELGHRIEKLIDCSQLTTNFSFFDILLIRYLTNISTPVYQRPGGSGGENKFDLI